MPSVQFQPGRKVVVSPDGLDMVAGSAIGASIVRSSRPDRFGEVEDDS